jgi:cytochrome b pre-mRNA-processing protein 3
MFASLFRRRDRAVLAAYGRIVERAREPIFYTGWGVPDTLDGRFELLALHAFLVLNRLKRAPEAAGFAQELFDLMFDDLDRSLREMGVADLGVGRRIKEMASAFLGRIAAYDKGLGDEAVLADALRRNLYGTAAPGPAQLATAARYVMRQAVSLNAQPIGELLRGEVAFEALESD